MKILFVSNLFPEKAQPVRGLPNATLLHSLHRDFDVEVRVISPRPVFPPPIRRTVLSQAQSRSADSQFSPCFPKVGYIPRLGSYWNERLMARGLRNSVFKTIQEFHPDIILGSWLFPDGCAVSQICKKLSIPVILISQGTDTHLYLSDPIRKSKIVAAIRDSTKVICRSSDLGERLRKAGVPGDKIQVIYNGIDPETFHCQDKMAARRKLGQDEAIPILLFVGNLLPVKNPLFLLQAHASLNADRSAVGLPRTQLKIIGEGPLRAAMQKESERLHTTREVSYLGRLNSAQVAQWMAASDVLCLSSRNEGFPNVILEAMACKLPVISTDVGGIREKINGPPLGRLVMEGDMKAYSCALNATLNDERKPKSQMDLSWNASARSYIALFNDILSPKELTS